MPRMDSVPGVGRVVGRYVLYDEIASGGMATVHLGRMLGQVGFARVVAVKKLHAHLARDPEFVAMFLDEARLAAGVRHPNVVATLDVVAITGELFLVMEYVEGDSLSHLIRATRKANRYIDPAIACNVVCGLLYGLHAAHIATDDRGEPLNIVHRDVSPQNVLIGVDGVTRVADFGVARASRRLMETQAGRMKGKFSYMAPEQVRHDTIDHRADVFAAGICAWEALTGRHLFSADDPARVISKLLEMPIALPSEVVSDIPPGVDAIVMRALERDPDKRFQTAREMAIAFEDAIDPIRARKVGEWVESHVGGLLKQRHQRLAEMQTEARPGDDLQRIAEQVSGASELPPPPDPASEPPREFTLGPPIGLTPSAPAAPELPQVSESEPPTATLERPPELALPSSPSHEMQSAPSPPSTFPQVPDLRTPVSNVSEVSSASYTSGPRSLSLPPGFRVQRSVVIALAGAGGVLALVALLITLVVVSRDDESSDTVETVATLASMPTPDLERLRMPTRPPPPASADPEPEPEPEPEAPPPKPVAAKPEPKPAKPAEATKPTWKPPPDCNPPYTIENGIKKFKRHCL